MALPPARVPVIPVYDEKRKPESYADFRAPLSEAAKGAAVFADQTQAVGGGAVALGAEALRTVAPGFAKPALESARDWGMGVYQRNMEEAQQPRYQPKVARVEDVKLTEPGGVERLGQWAAFEGTKGLLNVATMALGGLGGAAAGAGKVALKTGIKEFAKNEVAKTAATQAAKVGGIAGGALTSFGMEGGESFAGGVAGGTAPEAQVGPSLAVGTVNAVLDIVPAIAAAKYIGKGVDAVKGVRSEILADATLREKAVYLAKQVGKGTAGGVGAEGATEGLQELMQIAGDRWAQKTDVFAELSPEQRSQVFNAAAAGGLTGGLVGGGAGGIRGGLDLYARDESQPAPEAGAQAPQAPIEAGAVSGPRAEGAGAPAAGGVVTPQEQAAVKEVENLEQMAGMPAPDAGLGTAAPEAGYEAASFIPRRMRNAAALEKLKEQSEAQPSAQVVLDEDGTFALQNPQTQEMVATGFKDEAEAEKTRQQLFPQEAPVPQEAITPTEVPTNAEEMQREREATAAVEPVAEQVPPAVQEEVGQPQPPVEVPDALPVQRGPEEAAAEAATGAGEEKVAAGTTRETTRYPEEGMTPEDLQQAVIQQKTQGISPAEVTQPLPSQPTEVPNAQQEQIPTQPDGRVLEPQGPQMGEKQEGQVPADEGVQGVPGGGQEEVGKKYELTPEDLGAPAAPTTDPRKIKRLIRTNEIYRKDNTPFSSERGAAAAITRQKNEGKLRPDARTEIRPYAGGYKVVVLEEHEGEIETRPEYTSPPRGTMQEKAENVVDKLLRLREVGGLEYWQLRKMIPDFTHRELQEGITPERKREIAHKLAMDSIRAKPEGAPKDWYEFFTKGVNEAEPDPRYDELWNTVRNSILQDPDGGAFRAQALASKFGVKPGVELSQELDTRLRNETRKIRYSDEWYALPETAQKALDKKGRYYGPTDDIKATIQRDLLREEDLGKLEALPEVAPMPAVAPQEAPTPVVAEAPPVAAPPPTTLPDVKPAPGLIDAIISTGGLSRAMTKDLPFTPKAREAKVNNLAAFRFDGGARPEYVLKELRKKGFDFNSVEELVAAVNKTVDEGVLESRPAPFRSVLAESVGKVKQNRASGQQWLAMLEKSPGVKKEEIDDTMLRDWLGAQEGAVKKEDVQGFLDKGGVKVEEVVHADQPERSEETMAAMEALRDQIREAEAVRDLETARRLDAELGRMERATETPETKFASYQTPGGKNYRELLVTIPVKEEVRQISKEELAELNRYRLMSVNTLKANGLWERYKELDNLELRRYKPDKDTGIFKGPHWSEPNVLVHLRFNERTDADGKKVLFVEEVQSDWHQKGRKEGYNIIPTVEEMEIADTEGVRLSSIPNAPMKNTGTWAMLGMKRAIRWAAENGFDRVAWTPGEVQAERYDLSKQVSRIEWKQRPGDANGTLLAYGLDGQLAIEHKLISPEKVSDFIGKDLAEKLLNAEVNHVTQVGSEVRRLSGLDLKVGGKGMRAFYDKMLVNEVNKFGKKYGVRAGTTKVDTQAGFASAGKYTGPSLSLEQAAALSNDWNLNVTIKQQFELIAKAMERGASFKEAMEAEGSLLAAETVGGTFEWIYEPNLKEVWSIDITPTLREEALRGLPLYAQQSQYTPQTRDQFTQSADAKLGQGWVARAEQSGALQLNETSPPNAPSGSFDPTTGKLTVNLDKLPAGEPVEAVLFHEGGHAVLGHLVDTFSGKVKEQARAGNEAALRAVEQALKATADFYGIAPEEVTGNPTAKARLEQEEIGYFLQYAKGTPSGLFRRIINAIKAWWVNSALGQAFAKAGIAPELTEDLALAIVTRGLKERVRQAERAKELGVPEQRVELAEANELGMAAPETGVLESLPSLSSIPLNPLTILDAIDPGTATEQTRRRKIREWAQDKFIEGKDLEKRAVAAKGQLPGSEMFYDLTTQAPSKASELKKDLRTKYIDPIYEIAGKMGIGYEELSKAVYANHAIEANRRGRLILAKEWLHYIRDNVPHLAGQIRQAEHNLRQATRVPALDANGKQKTGKGGKLLWNIDRKKRRELYYQTFQKFHVLSPKDVFDELKPWDDKPSGMTDAEAGQEQQKWLGNAGMQQIFQLYDAMNQQIPGMFVQAGMLSQEMAAKWLGAYNHYATLKRAGYEEQPKGKGAGFSPAKASALRQFSPKPAVDVWANTLATADRAMDLIAKNEVATNFANFVNGNPDIVKGWFKVHKHDTKPYLDEDGMIAFGLTKETDINKDVLFWKDGRPFLVSAEPDNQKAMSLVQALNNLDAPNLQGILGMFAKATRFMAMVNTSLSPEFFLTNPIRDFGTALFNMSDSEASAVKKAMLRNYRPAAKALWKLFRAQSLGKPIDLTDVEVRWAKEFADLGGPTGWMDQYNKVEDRVKAAQRRMKELAPEMSFAKAAHRVLSTVEDANAMMENVIRLATYKALRETFPNEPVSKHIGIVKDMTVNFNRRGTAGPGINALYMFAGAGIQGSTRILQAIIKSRKVRNLVWATIGASFAVDQLNRAISQAVGDDDEYDKIPDYVKERNIVVMTPWGGAMAIPAPWGYNAIWAVGRTMSEALSAKMGDLPGWTAADAGYDLMMTFLQAFSPVQGGSLLQFVSPTVFDPLAQISENKTPFGEKLRPELFPGQVKPESEQYWANASGFSKAATRLINAATGGDDVTPGWAEKTPGLGMLMNPHHLDAVFAQVTGAVGRQTMDLLGLPQQVFGEDDLDWRRVPVARKFTAFPSSAQETAVYHDRVAQVLDVKRRLAAYSEGPRQDLAKARELRRESAGLLRMQGYAEDVEKQLKSLRKRMQLAEGRGDAAAAKMLKERMEVVRKRYNETWLRRVGN